MNGVFSNFLGCSGKAFWGLFEKLQVRISFDEKFGHLKAQIFDVEVSVTDVETFRELVFRFSRVMPEQDDVIEPAFALR